MASTQSPSRVQPIPPHLNTADLQALNQTLTSPTSPTTPHGAAEAQRAMTSTAAWKPSYERRQSWSKEEHKHSLYMTGIGDVKSGEAGFTERN